MNHGCRGYLRRSLLVDIKGRRRGVVGGLGNRDGEIKTDLLVGIDAGGDSLAKARAGYVATGGLIMLAEGRMGGRGGQQSGGIGTARRELMR